MSFWFRKLWNYKMNPPPKKKTKTVEPTVINSHVGGIFNLEIWMLWQLVFANTRILGSVYCCAVLPGNLWFYGLHVDVSGAHASTTGGCCTLVKKKPRGSLQRVLSIGRIDPCSVHLQSLSQDPERGLNSHRSISFMFISYWLKHSVLHQSLHH